MRLRHIESMSFGMSEHTMYTKLVKSYPHLGVLKEHDVVLIRSMLGNQLIFIFGFGQVSGEMGMKEYLRSERLRLTSRTPWHPLMLQNYANHVDIQLDGIKTFEEHMDKLSKESGKAWRPQSKKPSVASRAAKLVGKMPKTAASATIRQGPKENRVYVKGSGKRVPK